MMMSNEVVETNHTIVDVTPLALAKLKATLADKPNTAMRLGVVGGGCAGLQYEMQPSEAKTHGDFVQQLAEGVTLYIHPVAAAYLKGTTVDYSEALMDGGFKFINPNATNTCGCGTSFGV
jgi:iron-sulfur cluster assembly protein